MYEFNEYFRSDSDAGHRLGFVFFKYYKRVN